MSEIDELRQYVTAHPEDGERRWKLAKKLYMTSEYEAALGHLLWLKENGAPRLNIARYLAATYYRLGRYEDSITELEAALELWGGEVPLREQLARVLEVAGHRERAEAVWHEVLGFLPNHSTAQRALDRLSGHLPETAEQELHRSEHDSGIGLDTGWVCPNCGTQNSGEFDRCWRCHAQQTVPGRATPSPARRSQRPAADRAWVWTLTLGLAAVVCLVACTHLALRHVAVGADGRSSYGAYTSVQSAVEAKLFFTRTVLGITLLLVWPAVFWLGCIVVRSRRPLRSHRVLAGLLLASLTYLVSWSPASCVRYAPVVVAVASLIPVFGAFRLTLWRACALWIFQAGMVALVLAAGIAATVGPAVVTELSVINRALGGSVTGSGPNGVIGGPWLLPATVTLRCQSTGSDWLDSNSDTIALVLDAETDSLPITLEMKDSLDVVLREEIDTLPWVRLQRITLEEGYILTLAGPSRSAASLTVYSPLFPFILREQ
jgi:hypothetical protein